MGLCFSEIDPGQQKQLEELLAAVSTPALAPPTGLSATHTEISTRSLADVDLNIMFDRLTEFFRGNSLLSRQEFYDLARRSRR